jgi:uncharacterized protein (DUF2126 family)
MRWGEAVWGESRWDTEEGLEITLSDDEARQLGVPGWIDTTDLGQRLLTYWRTHPSLQQGESSKSSLRRVQLPSVDEARALRLGDSQVGALTQNQPVVDDGRVRAKETTAR